MLTDTEWPTSLPVNCLRFQFQAAEGKQTIGNGPWTVLIPCLGFGQDRVHYHQKPGGDTAGRADPTWPNRTWYSIPCAAMLGSGWGAGQEEGSRDSGARRAPGSECCSVHFTVSFLYYPYQYCCCYCLLHLLFC